MSPRSSAASQSSVDTARLSRGEERPGSSALDIAPPPRSQAPAGLVGNAARLSVLLLDGESTYAMNVVRCLAARPGVKMHVLSRAPHVPPGFSRYAASFHTWGGSPAADPSDEVASLAREFEIDLCMAVGEQGIEHLTLAGALLPVRPILTPGIDALRIALDKWLLSQFLKEHSLPHPQTVLCGRGSDLAALRAMRFPVLVKPRHGGNGLGILRIEDRAALERLADQPGAGTLIAQTIICGSDVDCSVLCRDGEVLAYTIQRGFIPTFDYKPPGGVEFIRDERVIAVVRALMRDLNWSGVAHVDLRYDHDAGDVKILEVNPRFWGSVLGSLHAGVNFPYLTCRAALGESFPCPEYRACRYVAGATAIGHWKRGRLTSRSAGFSWSDTMFRYAWRDPLPLLLESFLTP